MSWIPIDSMVQELIDACREKEGTVFENRKRVRDLSIELSLRLAEAEPTEETDAK